MIRLSLTFVRTHVLKLLQIASEEFNNITTTFQVVEYEDLTQSRMMFLSQELHHNRLIRYGSDFLKR